MNPNANEERAAGWFGLLTRSAVAGGAARALALLAVWSGTARFCPGAGAQIVTVALERGAERGGDMVLEFLERDGRLDSNVVGRAYNYNGSIHTGTVTNGTFRENGGRVCVELTIQSDPAAPGGAAAYEVELTRRGDVCGGNYAGVFMDRPVTGAVSGRVAPPLVREAPGIEPLGAGEHPRLIFRKKDLAELRRRAQTPEGQAMMGLLTERAPLRDASQVSDRHAAWIAANWGAICQLTGDKQAAATAREVLMEEVIGKPMARDRKDIHHATRLLGIGLAYDLCHDFWAEEFRRLVAEYIEIAASDLLRGTYEGFPMGDGLLDPDPWKHRNAIRMACIGTAAIAILGDPDTKGRTIAVADRLARYAEHNVVAYLRMGVTQNGAALTETPLLRDVALANGVLHFMHASRVALGRDLSPANPGILAGRLAGARVNGEGTVDVDLSGLSVQASGIWPMGLGAAPAEFLPGLKWAMDRDVGLQGRQHFGCAYPYQTAYALVNYPFGVTAKAPGEAGGIVAADRLNGHFVFRNAWQGTNDAVVELLLNLESMPATEASAGSVGLRAMGREWMRGAVGVRPVNGDLGADLLYAENEAKCAFVGMDLGRRYTPGPTTNRFQRAGPMIKGDIWVVTGYQTSRQVFDDFIYNRSKQIKVSTTDPIANGIPSNVVETVRRHVGIDFSGVSGSPVLVAIAEEWGNGSARDWHAPVVDRVKQAEHGEFATDEVNGARLVGRAAVPSNADLQSNRIRMTDFVFVVFAVRTGGSPTIAVDGAGRAAKAVVGRRTIRYDGRRIVFGE